MQKRFVSIQKERRKATTNMSHFRWEKGRNPNPNKT